MAKPTRTAKPTAQQYELVNPETLQEHPDNPRHGDVTAISESISANGFYGALVVQRATGFVLAGNHRLRAARLLKLDAVPVVYVDVDDDRAKRILLADNRTADRAEYNDEDLAALLAALKDDGGLAGTGYDEDDLADLLDAITDAPVQGAPEEFKGFAEDIPVEHQCPKCGYVWSGKSS